MKILFFLLLAATAAIVYFATRKKDDDNDSEGTGGIFPLKYGAKGKEVEKLQQAVNTYWELFPSQRTGDNLVVDGIWGPKTNAALAAAFSIGDAGVSAQSYNDIIAFI